MSIRNLQYLFRPKSIAVLGASDTAGSLGAVLMKNLLDGNFSGPVMPLNPRHRTVNGMKAFDSVSELPTVPDLAVIATPPKTVPRLVAELSKAGTRAVIVITTGLARTSEERSALRQALLDAARPGLLRIVGPNCLGVLAPPAGLNASFAHRSPAAGKIAFIAQSGAVVASMLDWAQPQNVGFSHLVSLGDMVDVDFGDLLDYLATDPQTTAILLYIESVSHVRKFMSAARAAARMKPVIVVKAGRHAESARAAASHTGALAGTDDVYDAAFRRAGVLRVMTLQELFDAVEILAMGLHPAGDRLAVVTNGGGIGVLATDELIDRGGRLAALSPNSIERLNAVLPPTWSRSNPVDMVGDAPGSRYGHVLKVLAEDPNVDAVLVLNCPTAIASAKEAAQAVAEAAAACNNHTVLTSWLGEGSAREAREFLAARRIPSMETPEQAARAFMQLVRYRRSQSLLLETPASLPEAFNPDRRRARAIFQKVLDEGRAWLTEPEAKAVLTAYAIPVVSTLVAHDADEAARLARGIGGPVALKIVSPDILHKSDVGGVELDITGPDAVREAARQMFDRVCASRPGASIQGFSVQPTIRRPHALELFVGATEDPRFGPVILFGHGGAAAEQIDDTTIGLPPLNMHLACEMIERTRVLRLLKGFRNWPPANIDAVALTLVKVAQLVSDFAEITELDVNPLLADEAVLALDARIRVTPVSCGAVDRLAIRPYPKELEAPVVLDGRHLLVRPIRPEDESALQAAVEGLTQQEIRLRFFAPIKTLTHATAARFTQIDYDREMALVLATPDGEAPTAILGFAQLSLDPNIERAEYAVFVCHNMQGKGAATLLSRRLIDYASRRGIREIYADILRNNTRMLKLARELGFDCTSEPNERESVHATLLLRQARLR
ncbi:MAG TPA: bifunctional acetate--CoA ligase family protein/GNAT family N-acetyltransferase [Gammaproteobacteria bacterium]|nr:bifunctional acetate--CoA ligase family protein/GNAT family N-acetyltransferase [Gammaproteobacteria bacterium]